VSEGTRTPDRLDHNETRGAHRIIQIVSFSLLSGTYRSTTS
jgi:hypothetical protein